MTDTITSESTYLSHWLKPIIEDRLSIEEREHISVLHAISGNRQFANLGGLGEFFGANLRGDSDEESNIWDEMITVIPFETGGGHFTVLIIDSRIQPARMIFQDPMGWAMENSSKTHLQRWFEQKYPGQTFEENFLDLQYRQQRSSTQDCGPIVGISGAEIARVVFDTDRNMDLLSFAEHIKDQLSIDQNSNMLAIRQQDAQTLQNLEMDVQFYDEKLNEQVKYINGDVDDIFLALDAKRNNGELTDEQVAQTFERVFDEAVQVVIASQNGAKKQRFQLFDEYHQYKAKLIGEINKYECPVKNSSDNQTELLLIDYLPKFKSQ